MISRTFAYAFGEAKQYGGGIPSIPFVVIDSSRFSVGDLQIEPVPVEHGEMTIFGYRIGKFAYATDCNNIDVASKEKLKNLDVLILDGLRFNPHPTHFSIDEAVQLAKELKPRMTYLTHMNHDVLHAETEKKLPENVRLGYDGLSFEIA